MRVKHVMVSEDKSLCGRQTTQGEGRDCGNCARISDKNSAKVAAMVPRGNGLVDDTLPALTDADVIAYGMDAADICQTTKRLPAGTEVLPGYWNCCQANPVVAIWFTDGDSGIVWRASCAADASTVHADRLALLPESVAAPSEEQLSASVPVVIVPTPEVIAALHSSTLLIAYKTAARHNGTMQLTRAFRATVAKFNKEYGQKCRTWADVRAVMIAAGVEGIKP